MIICPNCGAQLPDNARFCDKCGALVSNESQTPARPRKKAKKKNPLKGILILAGALVLLALILILAISLIKNGRGKKSTASVNAAFYIKDNQMYYNPIKAGKSMQVTKRLYPEDSSDFYGAQVIVTRDLKRVFYLDRIENGSNSFYVRDLKEDSEPLKIDSNVNSIVVLKNGSGVYYKNDESTLYFHDLKEKTRIAREVSWFSVSEDGKNLYYLDNEKTLYSLKQGEEREKVDRDVQSVCFTKDYKLFIYIKDGSLYRKEVGGDAEKIASDVNSVPRIFSENEVYYTLKDTTEVKLSSFVTDDMAAQDAALSEPRWPDSPVYPEYEYVDYPEYPDYPSRYDYDSRDEYDKAKEKYDEECKRLEEEYERACEEADKRYEEAYKKVEDQYQADIEQYYKDSELYYAKQDRDYLRESLDQNTYETTSYELYYWNGKDTSCITKNFLEEIRSGSSGNPVLFYRASEGEKELPKVKLSELSYAGEIYDKLSELSDTKGLYYITSGGESAEVDLENFTSLTFSNDGKTIYFMQDVNPEKGRGDLMKASVNGISLGTPELVQDDVSTRFRIASGGQIVTFMDVKDGKGEMYLDGKLIDEEVTVGSVSFYSETDEIYYYTDYSSDKARGTLKCWNGKEASAVFDDVHEYRVVGGGVLVLTDYSQKRGEGELLFVKGGKSEKIDEDVQHIYGFSVAP